MATPSTSMSFPELEGSSSWGSHYSSRSQGRFRSRRPQDHEKTPSSQGTMRAHSADARPQYGRSWEGGGVATRSCTALFFPPQESRAVVTPSPLYSPTRYGGTTNFAVQEEDGLLYDAMGIPQSTPERYGRTTERRSLSPSAPMIRQSRSTDSGGRNNYSRRSTHQRYQLESHGSWQPHHQPQHHTSPYYYEPKLPLQQQQNHTYNWSTHEPRALGVTDYEHLKASLIMFGDAHADQVSVYTGMSQQELLEKKRKDETSKRRKDKKYGKQKKKKNDRILNLPSSLREFTSSSTSLYPQSVRTPDRSAQNYPQQQRATATTQQSQGRTGLRRSLVRNCTSTIIWISPNCLFFTVALHSINSFFPSTLLLY
jgi:hypothetical protein